MSEESKSDFLKTQPYQTASPTDKTQTYGSATDKTQAYGSDQATEAYDGQSAKRTDKSQAHGLGVGDRIELNGQTFEIVAIISGDQESAEAVIYKIRDHNATTLALKMYYQFVNFRNEPNPEALSRIKAIQHANILRLYDFGTGATKYRGTFCFEICDFARGGNLLSVADLAAKFTPDFVERQVIPQLLRGITTLHQHKIYHCDLKPQNVFFSDEQQTRLVIGDYGSAKTFHEGSDKKLARTSMTKGTDFYLAPEQARGIVSEKNDYHALGMIILHLLYPDQVSGTHLNRIVERQFANQPIIDYRPEFGRLNQIIAGLTVQNHVLRWGQAEVERWLDGEEVPVHYSESHGVEPIKIGAIAIQTEAELVQFIETTSNWYEKIIADASNIGYNLVLRWLAQTRDLEAAQNFDRMVRFYQLNVDGQELLQDYVKEAILRYFVPKRPLVVDAKIFDLAKPNMLAAQMRQFFEHLEQIWNFTDLKKIKFYLFLLEFSLRQLAKEANSIGQQPINAVLEKIAATLNVEPEADFSEYRAQFFLKLTGERLVDLFYAFIPERGFKDLQGHSYQTVEQVGLFFAQNEDGFRKERLQLERGGFLKQQRLSKLAGLSYKEFLFGLLKNYVKTEVDVVETSFDSPPDQPFAIRYKIGKSLTDYLKQNKVEQKLEARGTLEETIEIQRRSLPGANWLIQDFVAQISQKHAIPITSITGTSMRQIRQDLARRKNQHDREVIWSNAKKVFKFINFPYFAESIAFLLPAFILVILIFGLGLANAAAGQFLSSLLPLNRLPGNWSNLAYLYHGNIGMLNLLLFLALVPATVLKLLNSRWPAKSLFVSLTIVGVTVLVVGAIALKYLRPEQLNHFIFITLAVMVLLLTLVFVIWFLKVNLWLGLLLLAGVLIFPGLSVPAPVLLGYIGLVAVLSGFSIWRYFRVQKEFHFFPFVMALASYFLLGLRIML